MVTLISICMFCFSCQLVGISASYTLFDVHQSIQFLYFIVLKLRHVFSHFVIFYFYFYEWSYIFFSIVM